MAIRILAGLIAVCLMAGGADAQFIFERQLASEADHYVPSPTLFEMQPGDRAQLEFPDGNSFAVQLDRTGAADNGTRVWAGHLVDAGEDFRVILTGGHGAVFGTVVTPAGNWSIESDPASGGIRFRDAGGLPPESGMDMIAGFPRVVRSAPAAQTPATAAALAQGSNGTISVGVVYTQGLVDYYGLGLITRIQQLINAFDQTLIDSDTGLRARLAGAILVPVEWDELTSTSESLDDLVAGASFGHPGTERDVFGQCFGGEDACTNDGDLSSLLAFRDGVGADLVVMIRRLYWPEHRYCGLAYVPGFGGQGVIDPDSDNVYGMAAVSVGPDGNGSGRDCTDLTFVHELGHNLGIVHNYENSGVDGGDNGVHAFSFAHRIDCSFRTAVGYDSTRSGIACDTRPEGARGNEVWLLRYSNPEQSDCMGQICGVAEGGSHEPGSASDNTTSPANAARSIREQGLNVQHFRPAVAAVRSALLPYSRTVGLGETATAFMSVANPVSSGSTALGCGLRLVGARDGEFSFQQTDPQTNAPVGNAGDLADIPAGGVQTFVISLTRPAAESYDDLAIEAYCANRASAPVVAGLNTFRFTSTPLSLADIIAMAATTDGNGIVSLPAGGGAGAFSVAITNLGAVAGVNVSVEPGPDSVDFDRLEICRTDPVTGVCQTARATSFFQPVGSHDTLTFAVFLRANADFATDLARNRVFVHFRTPGGQSVGATSVAVRTLAQ